MKALKCINHPFQFHNFERENLFARWTWWNPIKNSAIGTNLVARLCNFAQILLILNPQIKWMWSKFGLWYECKYIYVCILKMMSISRCHKVWSKNWRYLRNSDEGQNHAIVFRSFAFRLNKDINPLVSRCRDQAAVNLQRTNLVGFAFHQLPLTSVLLTQQRLLSKCSNIWK